VLLVLLLLVLVVVLDRKTEEEDEEDNRPAVNTPIDSPIRGDDCPPVAVRHGLNAWDNFLREKTHSRAAKLLEL
jgi:hypothetical protein